MCQRKSDIYYIFQRQSMSKSGLFLAEWFKRKAQLNDRQRSDGLWKKMHLYVWRGLCHAKNVLLQTETEHYWEEEVNYLSLSLRTVPQTVPPALTHPPCSPQLSAICGCSSSVILVSNPSVLHLRDNCKHFWPCSFRFMCICNIHIQIMNPHRAEVGGLIRQNCSFGQADC